MCLKEKLNLRKRNRFFCNENWKVQRLLFHENLRKSITGVTLLTANSGFAISGYCATLNHHSNLLHSFNQKHCVKLFRSSQSRGTLGTILKEMMRQIILTTFFTINLISAFGQEMSKENQKIVFDFIDCIKNHKKDKLISLVSFPFSREYPIPSIQNRQEFLKRYDEVFDEKLSKMIVNSTPTKDWSAVGWRGIMLLNGELWLDYDGRLIAVNYQSELEVIKKDELIKIEKSQLHESIKEFKYPIHILETIKYRIRIDDMGNYNYRYSSWKLEKKMSDKPDIIILNGEYLPDGSGGNHSFIFTNGEFKYECAIIILGEGDSPPAYLKIYKGDKEILSQKANIVTR